MSALFVNKLVLLVLIIPAKLNNLSEETLVAVIVNLLCPSTLKLIFPHFHTKLVQCGFIMTSSIWQIHTKVM